MYHPFPPRDANATGSSPSFEHLPEWDLSDLYPSSDSPEFQEDFAWLEQNCAEFSNRYQSKLSQLDAQELLECLQFYEKISLTSGRIMSFAGLRYYQQTTDSVRAQFLQNCQDKLTNASAALVFFTLEVNNLDPEALAQKFDENAELARYKPIFERMRAMRPHQLSDELERFLHDSSSVGASAWNTLFDETIAGLTFEINHEVIGFEAAANMLSDPERATREAAFHEISRVLSENIKIFSRVHNTLAKEKEIEDRWRDMPSPQASRHLANHVEPEVVEALRDAVVNAYPRLSHRYYALKSKWLKLDKMQVWDRNAPLPSDDKQQISWQQAETIVKDAYHSFDPRLAKIAEPFFTDGWIDAGVKPGKAPGAFAHPTVTDAHPYIMLNYLGKPRDVMTLAHELGHGVHQVLAAKQGELLSSTPLTLAETASVFGEMLTFKKLLSEAKSNANRKVLLAGKVEDMINTVVRQIAFYDFECKLHAARQQGELTPDEINEIWMSVQGESLGPIFEFADGYETFWSYIPHFVHSPFYVYAYAFGDGLVNALYAEFEENPEGFQDKYLQMLEAGGSKHHKDLLAPFGLDASDPKFWNKGLSMIEKMIDELEAMEA